MSKLYKDGLGGDETMPNAVSSVHHFIGYSEPAREQPQSTGIKHDQDKVDMSLLSSIALTEVAKVMTFGKKKYSANNWRGGFAWTRPLSASIRHIFAWMGGEDKDPETGLSHLAHAVCCLCFLLEFEVTHRELDDRYKQTGSSQ